MIVWTRASFAIILDALKEKMSFKAQYFNFKDLFKLKMQALYVMYMWRTMDSQKWTLTMSTTIVGMLLCAKEFTWESLRNT